MPSSIILKKNILTLFLISTIATSLATVAYEYSVNTTSEIIKVASDDIGSDAQNEAYDLSRIVTSGVDSVTDTLQLLSSIPNIQSGVTENTEQLFDAAQYSTNDITEFYAWIGVDGKVKTASNVAMAARQYDADWGDKGEKLDFLTEPQRTGNMYYSGVVRSPSDGIQRIYISHPIFYASQDNQGLNAEFRGVIVSSIRLDTLGRLLQSEIINAAFQSHLELVDENGVVIYSNERSIIGKSILDNPSYFGITFLPPLSKSVQQQIGDILKQSSAETASGFRNIQINGKGFTIAYNPAVPEGNRFWTMYIVVPHIFTDNVTALLSKQDLFTLTVMVTIAVASVSVGYVMVSRNKRLEKTVNNRTAELRNANASLSQSNSRLIEVNKQLEVHEKLQREFIDIAAHELRTPIMPILGMTDLLESQFRQGKEGEIALKKNDFDIISRNARRLEKLAVDILDVTRIESHTLHLTKSKVLLREITQVAMDDIKSQYLNDKVEFEILVPETLSIYADRERMIQVMFNILENAAKFTDEGKITVDAQENMKGNIIVSVSDTGIGLDSDILPRLFAKFSAKPGVNRMQSGSGLGLFISKSIVEAHGGHIWAKNNDGRAGATFYLSIQATDKNFMQEESVGA